MCSIQKSRVLPSTPTNACGRRDVVLRHDGDIMAGELQLLPLAEEGDPLLNVVGVPKGVNALAC
jgi:hypothetical protein